MKIYRCCGTGVHENDIKDLFETLMALERAAVALAARRIDSAAIGRLERLNERFKAAWDRHHFLDVTLTNSRFHRQIYAATGNEYMQSHLGSLQTQSQRLSYICFTRPTDLDLRAHADESIRDHDAPIGYLRNKDETGAVELTTAHIQRFRQRVADYSSSALLAQDVVR